MRLPDDLRPVQVSAGFNNLLGINLLESGPDGALGQLALRPEHLNCNDIAHGGIYCTLLDFGCGIAGRYGPPDAPNNCAASAPAHRLPPDGRLWSCLYHCH